MKEFLPEEIRITAEKIKGEISKVLVGKEQVTDYVLAACFAGGHLLLEDLPGTGKTLLAKTLAKAINGSFKRIQFTPDLLPADVTGLNYYDQKQGEFRFREGPVFAGILLADEINRATPRTQSSLLEAMEERQVSVDGETRPLPDPFFVIATQNPVEALGTFPLPEAQLDRFMMKLSVGFPSFEGELDMIERYRINDPGEQVRPVCETAQVKKIQEAVKQVYLHPEVGAYLLKIVQATRKDPNLLIGASPRSTLAFMRASQALAAVRGRGFVTPDDVKELAPFVLGHRVMRNNDYRDGRAGWDMIRALAAEIEPPTEPFSEAEEKSR